MPGRYTLTVESDIIAERFNVSLGNVKLKRRYNIAPTQFCPIIIEENKKRLLMQMSWGLIPHWSKEKKSSYSLINARAETVSSKPVFKNCFKQKRCLVPTDGYYEWKETQSGKIPYRITLKHEELFAFAGLWEMWLDEDGKEIKSFAIITTEPNRLIANLHERMPVILHRKEEDFWLSPATEDFAKLESMLRPYPEDEMQMYEVSKVVNSWKTDSPECIRPVFEKTKI